MANAFSNPAVRINDQTIAIVPNSYRSVLGGGETNVRAASAGGDSIDPVHTVNAESKIGKMMFDVHVTAENVRLIQTLKGRIGNNTVSAVETVGGAALNESLTLASLMNDPENQRSADGVISLEFAGAPITLS